MDEREPTFDEKWQRLNASMEEAAKSLESFGRAFRFASADLTEEQIEPVRLMASGSVGLLTGVVFQSGVRLREVSAQLDTDPPPLS